MTTTATNDTLEEAAFSAVLRQATWDLHEEAESSGFMTRLLDGRLGRAAYALLASQQYFVYETLEEASESLRQHPLAGRFVFDELFRVPAICADLERMYGKAWRDVIAVLPATRAYVDRLREVCWSQPGTFVAHHYTRYLGDLSGGLMIGRTLARRPDIGEECTAFYRFPLVSSPGAFKAEYRRRLDAIECDPTERAGIVEEVRTAYRLNQDLLAELGAVTGGERPEGAR